MKISLKWLNDYVKVDEFFKNPQGLSDMLTAAGIEVEQFESDFEKFNHVVVGHIIEKAQHPDADKLSLCQVDVGNGNTQQIICGANNHKQGDKVVVALPGAVLPGEFKIKKSKIRGVESLGMLCSEKELGFAEESPGIMILDEKAPIGEEFAKFFGLDDVVFELSVTPNRADCLSHIGLARELACLLDRSCQVPEPQLNVEKNLKSKEKVKLELKNADHCPRYAGRYIQGVKVQASPLWLKNKLESVGLNSINNVVDVTNFVMLELGQPLHAFDADKIKNHHIQIDLAQKGESFKTLDGTELTLTGDELMIRDGERPVAMAGVIGGENSGVSDETQNIFIESAFFTSETVRKTSRRFGIDTDSGYRFSRGVDPEGVILAMNRACELIQKISGGQVSDDFYDEYPKPLKRKPILIKKSFIEDKMGYKVDSQEFEKWMKALGCEISGDENLWQVTSPPFRWDLFEDVDLIEEYARLHGYDKIDETLPLLDSEPTDHHPQYALERRLENILVSEGYMQAMNYHFISDEFQKNFLGNPEKLKNLGLSHIASSEDVYIKNPLSDEVNVMRKSCLPGLFKNFLHNYRHGQNFGALFELGAVFSKKDTQYLQNFLFSTFRWGQKETLWGGVEKETKMAHAVYELKSTLENTLKKLGINSWLWKNLKENDRPEFFHPGQVVSLFVEGKIIGVLGSLHPQIKSQYKIRHDVALAELDFELLTRRQPRVNKYEPISKFPAVERDLAFLMPQSLAAQDVQLEIKKVVGRTLKDIYVFDRYESEKLPEGFTSVAFRMILQDFEKTLNDKELLELQDRILKTLEKKLGIVIR